MLLNICVYTAYLWHSGTLAFIRVLTITNSNTRYTYKDTMLFCNKYTPTVPTRPSASHYDFSVLPNFFTFECPCSMVNDENRARARANLASSLLAWSDSQEILEGKLAVVGLDLTSGGVSFILSVSAVTGVS